MADGRLIQQKVEVEWVPHYCIKGEQVGHICEGNRPKMVQKWVLKNPATPKEIIPPRTEFVTPDEPIVEMQESAKDGKWESVTKVTRRSVVRDKSII